jgi:hypothetical protein
MKLTPYGRAIKKGLIDRGMTQIELCRRSAATRTTCEDHEGHQKRREIPRRDLPRAGRGLRPEA